MRSVLEQGPPGPGDGRVKSNAFMGQDGQPRASLDVRATTVQFLGGREDQAGGDWAAVPAEATAGAAVPVMTGVAAPAVAVGKAGTKAAAIGEAGMPEVRPVTAVPPGPTSTTDRTFRSDPGSLGAGPAPLDGVRIRGGCGHHQKLASCRREELTDRGDATRSSDTDAAMPDRVLT